MSTRIRYALLFTTCLVGGCSSIDGHHVEFDANGAVSKVTPVGGVPIQVKTPTKAVFFKTVQTFEVCEAFPGADGTLGPATCRQEIQSTVDKDPQLIGPFQTYVIDQLRPFYGTAKEKIIFEKGQYYPSEISNEIDDKTFDQFRQIFEKVIDKGLLGPSAPSEGDVARQSGSVVTKTLKSSEVKMLIFDLKTGTLEVK